MFEFTSRRHANRSTTRLSRAWRSTSCMLSHKAVHRMRLVVTGLECLKRQADSMPRWRRRRDYVHRFASHWMVEN